MGVISHEKNKYIFEWMKKKEENLVLNFEYGSPNIKIRVRTKGAAICICGGPI